MDVTSTTTTQTQYTNTLATEKADINQTLGQEDFLKLMVAQVQNQDPFAPMENGDFIGQMAQFSSVDGINAMNASLENMSKAFSHGQSLQAATLVGRQVVAPSTTANLTAGKPLQGEVDLTDSVSSLVVNIRDSSGVLVESLDLGPQAAGRVSFSWDGRDSEGNQQVDGDYYINAGAQVGGEEQSYSTLTAVKVESVALSGLGTPQLYLANGTNIGLDEVEQIH
jgi:flagellar basal-body rod modification protein FlgD